MSTLREVLEQALEYERHAFDGGWWAVSKDGLWQYGPFDQESEAREAASTADAPVGAHSWDYEFREDDEVDGGDLVEFFGQWRKTAKAVLESERLYDEMVEGLKSLGYSVDNDGVGHWVAQFEGDDLGDANLGDETDAWWACEDHRKALLDG